MKKFLVNIYSSVVWIFIAYAFDDVVSCDFECEFVAWVFSVELAELLEKVLLLVLERL
jgi:hypothetical protein